MKQNTDTHFRVSELVVTSHPLFVLRKQAAVVSHADRGLRSANNQDFLHEAGHDHFSFLGYFSGPTTTKSFCRVFVNIAKAF